MTLFLDYLANNVNKSTHRERNGWNSVKIINRQRKAKVGQDRLFDAYKRN